MKCDTETLERVPEACLRVFCCPKGGRGVGETSKPASLRAIRRETLGTSEEISKLLISEPPLQVLPSLAKVIGLNEALMLQQLHYWIRIGTNEKEGFKWVYNSYESWHLQFPFWSARTIKRIVYNLEKQGLVISGNFNTLKMDKTKWYRIDYEKVQTLCQDGTNIMPTCHSDSANLSQAIPIDYIQENTTNTNTLAPSYEKTDSSKPPKLSFSFEKGIFENVPELLKQKWQTAFPAVDLQFEFEKMSTWLLTHPKNRKSDYPRFINNWLIRAQDRAGSLPDNKEKGANSENTQGRHTGLTEKNYWEGVEETFGVKKGMD